MGKTSAVRHTMEHEAGLGGTPASPAARHLRAEALVASAPGPVPDVAALTATLDGPPVADHPPCATVAELTPARLVDLVRTYGCVRIPGLLAPPVVDELVAGIDRTFARYDACDGHADGRDPWYDPYIPDDSVVHALRPWQREVGGVFVADSPVLAVRWSRLLAATGILDLVQGVFGAEPVTSLDKCVLRRVPSGSGIEWHQDGAFLGVENGALNLWTCLTDTDRAPGLDIVPRRLGEVVETGTEGAGYSWSTGQGVVDRLAPSGTVRPHFAPGDALLFDGLLLHRTAPAAPTHDEPRRAIETWFFRPSRFPDHQQIPMAF